MHVGGWRVYKLAGGGVQGPSAVGSAHPPCYRQSQEQTSLSLHGVWTQAAQTDNAVTIRSCDSVGTGLKGWIS